LYQALINHGKTRQILKIEKNVFGIFVTIEAKLNFKNQSLGNFRSAWEFFEREKK